MLQYMKAINPALKLLIRSDNRELDVLEMGSTRPVEVGEQQATRHCLWHFISNYEALDS